MADDKKYNEESSYKHDEVYKLFLATLAVTRQTLIIYGTNENDMYFGLMADHYNEIVDALCNNTDPTAEIFTIQQKWMLRNCLSDFKAHVYYIKNRVLSHEPTLHFDCRQHYVESLSAIERRRNPVI